MDTLKMMDGNIETVMDRQTHRDNNRPSKTGIQTDHYRNTHTHNDSVLLILWSRAVSGEGHELVFGRL